MFGFNKKYLEIIEKQKALLAELEYKVNEQNTLYRALFDMLSTNTPLSKDSKMSKYIEEGYEGNPDLFSLVLLLAGKFAAVMDDIKLVKFSKGKEEEVEDEEIFRLFEKTNYYQNFFEFCQEWAIFRYITGNSIVYAPRLTSGLNKGKLTPDGLLMMPTQDVTIKSGGWRQPIGYYTLDVNQTFKIEVGDVWHERFAPSLIYRQGKNFMGLSPVKVAANLINSQNKGYEITAKMYSYGHPPGILSKEVENGEETTAEQEAKFRERYRTKYQGVDNMAIPIFTLGKLNYTKIGFDNLKELEVVSMSEHGRRVFCNILQVPSQLLNDPESAIYNNWKIAMKAVYLNRIIPDVKQFCAGFNNILKAYGDYYIKPDLTAIDVLQEDNETKVKWVSQMYRDGIITGDEYLTLLGMEPTGLPEMQRRYIEVNRVPLDMAEEMNVEESDKFYREQKLDYGM